MTGFTKFFSLVGREVPLERLLAARENRVALQRRCLTKYGQTLLSLTLTAVGGVKKNELLDYAFAKSLEKLTALFRQLSVRPTAKFIRPLETGHEALFVVPVEAQMLKRAAIKLEESSPLARLWDIDVITADGRPLSRIELGFGPRPCLLCNDNAKVCARSRKHSVDEICAEMQRRAAGDYFAEHIGGLVYRALLAEARLTPKPGLVDQANNGAHRDMNLRTFEQSAVVLRPFFTQFVLCGMMKPDLPEAQVLAYIRPLGKQAENAMFTATRNVNTHKGSIFAFGLVCTAIGRLYQHRQSLSADNICRTVAAFTQGIRAELQQAAENGPQTAGVRLFRRYGLTGARGEAESGFRLVREVSLPVLMRTDLSSRQHARLLALLHLLALNRDTNVVHRGGPDGLRWLQREAGRLLNEPAIYQDENILKRCLTELDAACIERNLSAGGSADLLALTIFFRFLTDDQYGVN